MKIATGAEMTDEHRQLKGEWIPCISGSCLIWRVHRLPKSGVVEVSPRPFTTEKAAQNYADRLNESTRTKLPPAKELK